MPVPLLDVNAQNHPLSQELTAAFQSVLQSGQFIMGPDVAKFEAACAEFTGCPFNLGVSSGTDALLLAMMALDIGPGDEVIVPAFTFFATAGCVTRLGAVPIFADVCPECFTLDVDHAAGLITPRTKAIIPVHLFGQMADMPAIMSLAGKHGLKVIEDAAQAFGASSHGQTAGSIGDFGCYSFFPSKNLGALGDAGLLATRNPQLAEKARILRVHGMEPKYYHKEVGANFRIDTLQAAFLQVKLRHYSQYTDARRSNARRYSHELAGTSGVFRAGSSCPTAATPSSTSVLSEGQPPVSLVLPGEKEGQYHIWNQYTLRVTGAGQRDRLRNHLQAAGIGCEIYYPLPLNQQPCYSSLVNPAAVPVSQQLATEVLSLPVYPELSAGDQDKVVHEIKEFLLHRN